MIRRKMGKTGDDFSVTFPPDFWPDFWLLPSAPEISPIRGWKWNAFLNNRRGSREYPSIRRFARELFLSSLPLISPLSSPFLLLHVVSRCSSVNPNSDTTADRSVLRSFLSLFFFLLLLLLLLLLFFFFPFFLAFVRAARMVSHASFSAASRQRREENSFSSVGLVLIFPCFERDPFRVSSSKKLEPRWIFSWRVESIFGSGTFVFRDERARKVRTN